MPIIKNKVGRATFILKDSSGAPLSNALLTSKIRKDGSPWVTTANLAVEQDSTSAPGIYDLPLNASETSTDVLEIYVTYASGGAFVYYEKTETESADLATTVFDGVFKTPVGVDEVATQQEFLDRLADTVLRRSQGSAESGLSGETPDITSLLGVISLMTQGQTVTGPDCNGQHWLYANSALSGGAPLGAMRVVFKDGNAVGLLPHTGPNSVEQAGGSCYTTQVGTSPATSPGTFLPVNGCG